MRTTRPNPRARGRSSSPSPPRDSAPDTLSPRLNTRTTPFPGTDKIVSIGDRLGARCHSWRDPYQAYPGFTQGSTHRLSGSEGRLRHGGCVFRYPCTPCIGAARDPASPCRPPERNRTAAIDHIGPRCPGPRSPSGVLVASSFTRLRSASPCPGFWPRPTWAR